MTQDKKTTLGINYNTFGRSIIKKKKNPLLNKKEEKKIQAWCKRRVTDDAIEDYTWNSYVREKRSR